MHHRSSPLIVSLPVVCALAGGCGGAAGLVRTDGFNADGEIAVGAAVVGDTSGGSDRVTPACGAVVGSPERRYAFRAPSTGRFSARSAASFDGLLAVYPEGGGEPLECNDDDGSPQTSRVEFDAVEGRVYDLVVDGYHGAAGPFALRVDAATAGGENPNDDPQPPDDLVVRDPRDGAVIRRPQGPTAGTLTLDQPVRGTTVGSTDRTLLSCGAPTPGTPDVAYDFVAPEAGLYTFRTQTDFDGTLAIFRDGQELACNDDDQTTRASRVSSTLEAGRHYTVVVDGYGASTGTFELVARHPVYRTGGSLTVGQAIHGVTTGGADRFQLPCGSSQPGTPDASFQFTAPEDGVYVFRVTSDYDGVLAVYESGTALVCNDDDQTTRASRVNAPLVAGHTYDVVVDGFGGASGEFDLIATHPVTRPAGPIAIGQTVTGDTNGGADVFAPPCGSQPGTPEQDWSFVAPVTATYRLHVDSDFDGVLAVYPDGATDPLLCNDDAGSTRASEIEGSLIGGQRYHVVVDGYGGSTGTYSLSLQMLNRVGGTPVAPPSTIQASIHGGPLPEDLRATGQRCGAAPAIATGHYSATIDATGTTQVACGNGGPGGDQIFTLTLTEARSVNLHAAADFPVALEVREGCSGASRACEASTGAQGADVSVVLPAGTYAVVVDALDGTSRGPVHLDVNLTAPR